MRFRSLAIPVRRICLRNVDFQCSQPCVFLQTDFLIGATSGDFERLVSKFYEPKEAATDGASSAVDRPLFETVWGWLTDRPEVSVGEYREGNALSLSEFEDSERRHADSTADAAADEDQPIEGQATETKNSAPLRVFTSTIRKWQTITGHAPDVSLIPPAEFQALCFIAAAGEDGILQTELAKLSGQDKRSLPRRTDNLANNGYIEKRPYYIKNVKTSLLRHRKFCRSDAPHQGNPTVKDIFKPDGFDFDHFIKVLANMLQTEGPVTLTSLHHSLGIAGGSKWQFRCVRRGLDKLEVTGIISRFRARRQVRTNKSQTHYIRCVKLVRVPTDEDRKTAHAISNVQLEEFRQRLEKEANEELNGDGDAHIDPQLEGMDDGDDIPEVEALEQVSQQYAPSFLDLDEPFTSFFFRAVQRSGVKGISTSVGERIPPQESRLTLDRQCATPFSVLSSQGLSTPC